MGYSPYMTKSDFLILADCSSLSADALKAMLQWNAKLNGHEHSREDDILTLWKADYAEPVRGHMYEAGLFVHRYFEPCDGEPLEKIEWYVSELDQNSKKSPIIGKFFLSVLARTFERMAATPANFQLENFRRDVS
jgi:hypothetical protein